MKMVSQVLKTIATVNTNNVSLLHILKSIIFGLHDL